MNGCKKFWGAVGTDAGSVWNMSVTHCIRYAHGEGKQTAVKMEKSICGGRLFVAGRHK